MKHIKLFENWQEDEDVYNTGTSYDSTEEEKTSIELFNGDVVRGPAQNKWDAKDIAAVIDSEMEQAYDAHLQNGGDRDDKEFLREIFLKHEDELYDLGYTEA